MPLPEIAPADVPSLIPGAPAPETAHVDLAGIWAAQELLSRGVSLDTTWSDAQLTLLKTAIAAKALALKAGLGGVVTLEGIAKNGAARVIDTVEIPDEVKVKYTKAMTGDEALTLASSQWDDLALRFLVQALPASKIRRAAFVGVSR